MQMPKPHRRSPGFLILLLTLAAPLTGAAGAEPLPAEDRAERGVAHKRPARSAPIPLRRLAERLDLHWLNTALERPKIGDVLRHNRVALGKPFGARGPELQLSWDPGSFASPAERGDPGPGDLSATRPELHLGLRRSW